MKKPIQRAVIAGAIVGVLAACAAVGDARPPVAQAPRSASSVVPDCAAMAIVKEAGDFIRGPLTKPPLSVYRPRHIPVESIRANALMIVLVAENRMTAPGADTPRLAALRDAAIQLTQEVGKNPRSINEIDRLSKLIDSFPNIPADRAASTAPVHLKEIFNHDDILGLVSSCTIRTHRIEFHLFRYARQKQEYKPAEIDAIEMLAYKAALISGFNRELDHHVPKNLEKDRPQWAQFADAAQASAWRLAEMTRGGDSNAIKNGLRALNSACAECHSKFRD